MTQTTARPARPAQLAPVRIGNGVKVHLGHLSSIKGPNGEPRYCSYCPASAGRDGAPYTAGEAVTDEIDCRSCQRQAGAEALQRGAATARAARTAEQIEADGAKPASAAQQAQLEHWLAGHDGASIPQALAADEVDAYAADGFMTASRPVAIQDDRQDSAATAGSATVTTNDLGIVAVTTGTLDNPRLVCLNHFPDAILGEFERDDLDTDEKCHQCGATLGHSTVDLDDPGAVLASLMSALIWTNAIEVNVYSEGVEIGGPDGAQIAFINGTFTTAQTAAFLRIDEEDIKDCRDATNN